MGSHKELTTVLLVTAVTILIWFWAAGETLDQGRINARVTFTLPDADAWLIEPRQQFVDVTVEGSKLALQQAEARRDLTLPLPAGMGRQSIDLLEELRRHRELQETGVKILSVDPATIEVDIDAIEYVPTRVRAALPGVQTVGEIDIEPAQVTLAIPRTLRQRYPGELAVEAFVDRSRLDQLAPGMRHTLDVKLRPPDGLAAMAGVSIEPSTVNLSFTVRSRHRDLTLDSVRIQLAGPPEDNREYLVDFDESLLRDVTITAEADLVRRIESNEATVIAVVHLSNREKEQRIERKAVTYFLAIVPDGRGGTRGVLVDARVGNSSAMPEVPLQITRRPVQ